MLSSAVWVNCATKHDWLDSAGFSWQPGALPLTTTTAQSHYLIDWIRKTIVMTALYPASVPSFAKNHHEIANYEVATTTWAYMIKSMFTWSALRPMSSCGYRILEVKVWKARPRTQYSIYKHEESQNVFGKKCRFEHSIWLLVRVDRLILIPTPQFLLEGTTQITDWFLFILIRHLSSATSGDFTNGWRGRRGFWTQQPC